MLKFSIQDLHIVLLTIHKIQEIACGNSHIFKGAQMNFHLYFSISQTIEPKFCTGNLNVMPLSKYEFHENPCSKSYFTLGHKRKSTRNVHI